MKSSSVAPFSIHKLPARDYSLWSFEVDDNMILMPSEGEREGKFSTKGGGRTRNSSKREEGFFFYPVF